MALKIAISPEGKEKIARSMGYKGDMRKFKEFLASDPSKQAQLKKYYKAARGGAVKMLKDGGVIGYATGGQTAEQAKNKLAAYGATTKGSGGDYSNPESFKNYTFSDPNFQYEDLVETMKAAGAGTKSKAAADLNVKHGAGAGAYKHTDVGTIPNPGDTVKPVTPTPKKKTVSDVAVEETLKNIVDPTLKEGQKVTPTKIDVTDDQILEEGTGKIDNTSTATTTKASTAQADDISEKDAETYEASTVSDTEIPQAKGETGTVTKEVEAAEQTESSVSDLTAAQGEAIIMNNPVQREIEDGELITGVSTQTADAQKAAKFVEEVQAATATPTAKATVKGQLDELMDDFEGGQTPPWAAGAMRAATAKMLSRGLSSSSMAGQAIIQAAMESAMPIAQADAATQASFESQNLSNRQQVAMHAAQQRANFMKQEFDQAFQAKVINASKISDIANMNFTAEQQVALENSRNANTVNLANLNNKQALVMAEAAALSQLDLSNLSNQQQASVENAKNFLQIDMANLNNAQQAAMFNAQSAVTAMFTDQAAKNAAKQFNATSENQTNQFFSSLKNNVSQFNTAQTNAMNQFNAGEENANSKFNTQMQNQVAQFNAQNEMVIAQSNVQWRRAVATQDTVAMNRANELNAQALLGMSSQAYANAWQFYGDSMNRSWTSGENALDRVAKLAMTQIQADASIMAMEKKMDAESSSWIGSALFKIFGF